MKSNIPLIFSVSRRFSSVDRKSRSSFTARLSALGICFGVMTLIVVIGVMNGFQLSFINAIQEVSSYHVQVEGVEAEDEKAFLDFCSSEKNIKLAVPFYEAQTLMCSVSDQTKAVYESPVVIRGLPDYAYYEDEGFRSEIFLVSGSFNLENKGTVVLGNQLARSLRVKAGDTVNLFVLSGSSDVELFCHRISGHKFKPVLHKY